MTIVEFELVVAAAPDVVAKHYWAAERWPELAPHVRDIRFLYEDPDVQVLVMTVETRGRIDSFKSVRVRESGAIRYFQPTPPPILGRHDGSWTFDPVVQGTRVVSRHALVVNVPAAQAFLQAAGCAYPDATSVQNAIADLIRSNSLQTMRALKSFIEYGVGNNGVAYSTATS